MATGVDDDKTLDEVAIASRWSSGEPAEAGRIHQKE
jgi:hypothetical protein